MKVQISCRAIKLHLEHDARQVIWGNTSTSDQKYSEKTEKMVTFQVKQSEKKLVEKEAGQDVDLAEH